MSLNKVYNSSQVARVAGMTNANFRMQFTRGHWRNFSNVRPGDGHALTFTLEQAMVYALARKLTDLGFDAGEAFTTALFGLEQSSVDNYSGKAKQLFDPKKGDTYFIAYPGIGNNAAHGEFLFSRELHGLEGLFLPYGVGPGISGVEQFVVINLTAMHNRLLAELEGTEA